MTAFSAALFLGRREAHLSRTNQYVVMIEYYRTLSGNEKLQILLELIMPENPDGAVIEGSARVHPLTEHEECEYQVISN